MAQSHKFHTRSALLILIFDLCYVSVSLASKDEGVGGGRIEQNLCAHLHQASRPFIVFLAATNLMTLRSAHDFKVIFLKKKIASVFLRSKASQRWKRHSCLCGKTCLPASSSGALETLVAADNVASPQLNGCKRRLPQTRCPTLSFTIVAMGFSAPRNSAAAGHRCGAGAWKACRENSSWGG